jgi:2-isopropylmalate synthase
VKQENSRASTDSSDNPDQVLILDTTLRTGMPTGSRSMPQTKKLCIARALVKLGVDIIEAGCPAASRDEWGAVSAIASEAQGSIICALTRCDRHDVKLTAKAVKNAPRHRIRVCLAVGAVLSQRIPNREEQLLDLTLDGVRTARDLCEDVEFSAQGAFRTAPSFLAEVIDAAIDAGASSVNIPDTVGDRLPDEVSELFRYLRTNIRNVDRIRLSVHCSDTLGLAVANSLAAVIAGARQVDCSVTSAEPRGNCALDELVRALNMRAAFLGVRASINLDRLSSIVSEITGISVGTGRGERVRRPH